MCVQDLGMGKECVCVFTVLYMLFLVCRIPLNLKFSFCGSFYSFPVRLSFLNVQGRRFLKRPATFKDPYPGLGVWLGSRMWPQRVGNLSDLKLERQTSGHPSLKAFGTGLWPAQKSGWGVKDASGIVNWESTAEVAYFAGSREGV